MVNLHLPTRTIIITILILFSLMASNVFLLNYSTYTTNKVPITFSEPKNDGTLPSKLDAKIYNYASSGNTRSRYLEHYITLDGPEVQLMVRSGDAFDNSYNIGGGSPIVTGDINNDGIHDVLIGCPYADGPRDSRGNTGQVLIIFGDNQTHPNTIYDQSELKDDEIDIVIHGADNNDLLGFAVGCADIDGDVYDDIIISAPYGDSFNNNRNDGGEVYVFYGGPKASFDSEIDLRSTIPDFMIYGASGGDRTGYSIALGNVIGDNKIDMIIGATLVDPGGRNNAGMVYVLAGDTRSNFGSYLDLSSSRGSCRGVDYEYEQEFAPRGKRSKPEVKIEGVSPDDRAGFEVNAGDINGDGRDDILIGARHAQYNASRNDAGVTYLIYGDQLLPSLINLTTQADVYIYGADTSDNLGWDIISGDINGDSYEDIILGTPYADGPNNGQRDSGEVYIIYGSNSLAQYLDLRLNEYDVIIYGENAWDNFGYSVAVGEVDNDKYTDFLIGSRHANGENNDKNDCGETYLIMGNTSSNFGNNIDPITKSKTIFFGIDIGDNSGMFVSCGDLDGDGLDDIFIGAPYADGPSNGRDSSGEFYLIYSDAPQVKNEFLTLLDGDLDNKTIFARYRPYTFRVNSSNILGYDDFETITLTIDPFGHNIVYRWIREENIITCLSNPDILVECVSSSDDVNTDGWYNYSVDFKFIFNWNFTSDKFINCQVSTECIRSYPALDQYTKVFLVRNKLTLQSEVSVSGAQQGKLKPGDWVKGAEELTFSGPTVIYEAAPALYPPVTEYSLAIEENSNTWSILNPQPGNEITATINAPESNGEYLYKLKILGIPQNLDMSDINFILKVDSEPPKPPENFVCKADSFSEPEAVVDDDDKIYLSWSPSSDTGSGINGYYYGFSDLGGTDKGHWTLETKTEIENGTEGWNQFYAWSEDKVGNIGFSSVAKIFIDKTEVTFENFTPQNDIWLTQKLINCTIQIHDYDGFGVDSNSVEYLDMQSKKWLPLDSNISENLTLLNISVTAELSEGRNSYIQFRASDIAGNGPTESERYLLKIDTTPVKFSNILPNTTEKQSTREVRCYITVDDSDGSGVNLSTLQYSYSTNGVANFTKWTSNNLALVVNKTKPEVTSTWFVDLIFKRGMENYIRWRAKDLAGNDYGLSENYSVVVNALPVIIIDGLEPDGSYDAIASIELNAEQSYDPDDELQDKNFCWYSNISGALGTGKVIITRLPAGLHNIELIVFDGQNYATKKFNITVISPKAPSKKDDKGMFGVSKGADSIIIGLIIIILIIIILFLIVYLHEKRIRKRLEEKAFGPGTEILSKYQAVPHIPGGKDVPELAKASGASPQELLSISASPYGPGAIPGIERLPTIIGGPGATKAGDGAQFSAQRPTIVPPAGVNLPKLPPAQFHRYPSMQKRPDIKLEIDTKKKIELLEKKMLLGEIPIDLYNKLSKKYEEEIKSKKEETKKIVEIPSAKSEENEGDETSKKIEPKPVIGVTPDKQVEQEFKPVKPEPQPQPPKPISQDQPPAISPIMQPRPTITEIKSEASKEKLEVKQREQIEDKSKPKLKKKKKKQKKTVSLKPQSEEQKSEGGELEYKKEIIDEEKSRIIRQPRQQSVEDVKNDNHQGFESAPGFTPDELEFLRKLRRKKDNSEDEI